MSAYATAGVKQHYPKWYGNSPFTRTHYVSARYKLIAVRKREYAEWSTWLFTSESRASVCEKYLAAKFVIPNLEIGDFIVVYDSRLGRYLSPEEVCSDLQPEHTSAGQ